MSRLPVWLFGASTYAALLAVSLLLGKDLNWDFLNYHFYGAHLLLEGRWQQDYFAGSFQSYLNATAHVPHYLMIRAGWSSVAIGVVLTSVHALNLVLVWRIARKVQPADSSPVQAMFAVALAALAPLYLTTVGSSFADPITSLFILAGICVLLDDGSALTRSATGGLLLGVAAGLKLTNVLFLAAIGATLTVWWVLRRDRPFSRVVVFGLGAVAGGILAHGPWSWQLWKTFASPVFPLFNSVFGASDFPAVTYRDVRFLGEGAAGLLTLPFQMTMPVSWLYSENVAVDFRFAALVVVAAACLLIACARRAGPQLPARLVLLSVMMLVSYLVWGFASRIGRYALPLWLLLGPLLACWMRVLVRRADLCWVACGAVVAVQAHALWEGGNPRWSPALWGERWLEVTVPPELARQPHRVLTLGMQSFSAVVPFLHPQTRAVNLTGQFVQPVAGRMPARLRQILDADAGTLRAVFRDPLVRSAYEGQLAAPVRADVDAVLSSYGLKLSPEACQPIMVKAQYIEQWITSDRAKMHDGERLHVCALQRLPEAVQAELLAQMAAVDRAFDNIERACGKQIDPHDMQTLRGRGGWLRTYFNSLNTVATDGTTVFVRPFRSMVDVDLGPLAAWQVSPSPTCPRLPASISRPQ